MFCQSKALCTFSARKKKSQKARHFASPEWPRNLDFYILLVGRAQGDYLITCLVNPRSAAGQRSAALRQLSSRAWQALHELALLSVLAVTMSFFGPTTFLYLKKSSKNRDFPTSSFGVKISNFSTLSSNVARIRPVLDHIEELALKFDTMSSNEPPQVGHFPLWKSMKITSLTGQNHARFDQSNL